MNFINNYSQPIQLAAGATSAALSLPNGDYVLTLSNPLGDSREIVSAAVAGGMATLVRGQEGTEDQLWPSGSIIYCDLTAATLMSILQRLDALEAVQEPDGSLQFVIQAAERVNGDFTAVGFSSFEDQGSISSAPSELGGAGGLIVTEAYTSRFLFAEAPPNNELIINGTTSTPVTTGNYLLNGPNIPTDYPVQLEYFETAGVHEWEFYCQFGDTEVLWSPGEITITLTPAP